MADYGIPKSGVAYIFYGCLVSQADTKLFKSTPTLAAGDFKVSIDGGAFANLATLPTNTPGTYAVKFSLSAAEMTGDNILVVASDAAGAEWCDQCWNIQTSPRGIADLAYPATSGRSMVVDAAGLVDSNVVKLGPSGSGTAQTARDVGGNVDVATSTRLASASYTTPPTTAQIATGVWQDTTAGDFTVASSIGKSLYTTGNAPGAASGLALVGSNMGTVSSVTGSVGSVTGAVGSVTGNVGGNVVGSVASVTGNVGGNVVGSVASVTGNVGGNVVGSVASVTAAVAITSNVKTNQALGKFEFMMTDSTNHAPATGKTVSVTRSIDGAAFAAGTLSAVTEVSNGIYYVDFGAGDLNGKVITLRATAAGCDDTFVTLTTQP